MTAGGARKSISATHMGKISRPAYFCHFCESVLRRAGTVVKSKAMRAGSVARAQSGRQASVKTAKSATGVSKGGFEPRSARRAQRRINPRVTPRRT